MFSRVAIALACLLGADDPSVSKEVVPAVEAVRHVGERVTVETTIRASKNAVHHKEIYLDSEENFRDAKNFAVVISYDHLDRFKEVGIAEPAEYYKGKTLRVTGEVIREEEQVRIRVERPDRIEVVGDRS